MPANECAALANLFTRCTWHYAWTGFAGASPDRRQRRLLHQPGVEAPQRQRCCYPH